MVERLFPDEEVDVLGRPRMPVRADGEPTREGVPDARGGQRVRRLAHRIEDARRNDFVEQVEVGRVQRHGSVPEDREVRRRDHERSIAPSALAAGVFSARPPGEGHRRFGRHWGLSRKGKCIVKKRTAKGRFRRSLDRIAHWCRRHRHDRVGVQHRVLGQKLRGHYAYYGVTSNAVALKRLYFQVVHIWHKWLSRRSQRRMTWEKMYRLLERLPLPRPRIVHRYGT